MRISVIKGDPGFVKDSSRYKVLYNGYERNHVFTADEEKRLIVCAKLDSNGQIMKDKHTDGIAMETLYGDVYIEQLLEDDVPLIDDDQDTDFILTETDKDSWIYISFER